MLKRLLSMIVAALVILATLPVAPAQAWFPRGTAGGSPPPPVSCPQAIDNGCSGANQNSNFINTNLLTMAQQNGQNSLLPTRASGSLTLNIPAVDYPVGPDGTLTPQDPRTINTSNCSWIHTGGNAPPNDYIGCYGSGVITVTLNNYDFSGSKIGQSPIGLYLGGTPSAGSSVTITNSYFAIQPNNTTVKRPLAWGASGAGNWSIVYKYNQCDGASANANSPFCLNDDSDNAGTTIDIEYNAFTNLGVGRVAGGFRYMVPTWKHNFIEGLNNLYTANHGEVELRTCSQNGCTSSETYEGNFIIWDANANTVVNNATFYPSTGNTNRLQLSALTIKNNVIVTNKSGGTASIGKAILSTQSSTLGDVTITGNWVDASGSFFCAINGPASNGVTASASGNTLTITSSTSSFNNNPIEIGWKIVKSGFTTASITAFQSGGGNLGTYTFDGPTQTVGSSSGWILVPGYSSFTANNNYNLISPGTEMGLTAPQMTATTCLQ